ncbi:MAG TPA: hypothetical protein VNS83_03565, partial [Lapillicoccus sp.]|nr:hypothetical protein [Lapillicoccus sp.]
MTTPSEFRRRVYQEEAPPDELALDGEALVVTTPEAERGGVMLDLALVLAARSDAAGLRGPDADLRRANDLLREAISYPLGRPDAVAVLVNRSVVLLRLFERDNDAQLLVEATNCLEAAREREGDYSTSSPAIHTMLGSVLLRRAEQGGEQRLRDDSVRWLDRAVRATDRTSPDWLGRNANLANALLQQAENGDLEALDRVVALADDLLASQERGSPGQKNALLVAARAYRLLALWSDAPEALDRAIDLGRTVVAKGVDDEAGTRASGNLGNALVHKAMTVHDGRLLDEAVQVLTVARAGMRGRPADLALQTANLGRARLARFGVTNDFEDAQAAVELFSEIRSSRVLDPGLMGQVEANLGLAYLAMADATTEDAGLYEVALEHVLSGLGRLDPEDEPWLALEAAHGIGDRLVADGRFGLAADVLAVAAAALEVSVGISQTAAPARVLARTEGVAPLAAYAMALAGRPEDAVVVLERGRARGLRTTLGLDDDALDELRRAGYSSLADAHARIASSLARSVDEAASGGSTGRRRLLLDQLNEVRRDIRAIPAFADFAVAPDFEAIRDQARGDPLVYGSVTAYGAVLLVVWADGTV